MTWFVILLFALALLALVVASSRKHAARFPRVDLIALGLALVVAGYLLQYLVVGQHLYYIKK